MDYHAPTALNHAIALMAAGNVNVIAGGTDVFPARGSSPLRQGLLDVTRIDGLDGITRTKDGFRIGAATRWTSNAQADLPSCYAGLQAAAREVGSVQIQNAGTIAGNICNASPAADGIPPLLTLGAEIELAGPDGLRRLPLAEFVTGPRQIQLRADELITAILIPSLPAHTQGAFEKLGSRKYLVISITMVAVVIGCDAAGKIDFARISVGACSPVAQRLHRLEDDLIGLEPQVFDVTDEHLAPLSPITDVRGDDAFRLDVVAEQIKRAVLKAVKTHG